MIRQFDSPHETQRIGMSAVVGLIFLGFLVWLTVPREDQVAK